MSLSQFTIYTSSDPYGPGPITGTTGSLIAVLDACLVNGYGTGSYTKAAAGWTHALPTISASCVASYLPPSGSRHTLFVNDNAPTTARTAAVTGYVTLTSMSFAVNSSNVGFGYGQFPTPAQANTIGKIFWYKSATADTVQRQWILAADAYTFYIWFADGQTVGNYYHGGFGDFYSSYGNSDIGRCLLFGKYVDNNNTNLGYEYTDCISTGCQTSTTTQTLNSYLVGHYVARQPSGTGGSLRYTKKGDWGLTPVGTAGALEASYTSPMSGILATPNPTDNSFYLSPIWIVDIVSLALRGKYRGIYQICHPLSNFSNGQIINGTGVYAGKTFMIIMTGYQGGAWVLETSPTVITN